MATWYYTCAGCEQEIKFRHAGKSRSDTERYCKWLESQGHLCGDCRNKKREEDNARAADENQAAGLPALTGSDKQVSWAESIRASVLGCVDEMVAIIDGGQQVSSASASGIQFAEIARHAGVKDVDSLKDVIVKALPGLRGQSSASWWIDRRSDRVSDLVIELYSAGLREDVSSDLVADVKAEATVQPESPVIKGAVEVEARADKVIAKTPYWVEDLASLLRGLGFRWEEVFWSLPISQATGGAEDRAAELVNALLLAGCPVCCMDEHVRSRGVEANFEPRYPLWIVKMVGGRWDGYLRVSWQQQDDIDGGAIVEDLTFLNARRDYRRSNTWYIRPNQHAAILEFAETHGFRVTDGAKKDLDQARVDEESRLLVRDVKQPSHVSPDKHECKDPCGIDPELVDD